MHSDITTEKLMQSFRINIEEACILKCLVEGCIPESDMNNFPVIELYRKQRHSGPSYREKTMVMINSIIGGYGIERLYLDNGNAGPFGLNPPTHEYVNMGDTYKDTIIYDIKKGKFSINSWNGVIKNYHKEKGQD